jgi:Domain of unknown function (DUF1772)
LTLGVVPWTLAVMAPTNRRLQAHATRDDGVAKTGVSVEEEAHRQRADGEVPGLLRRWTGLNAIRGLFPLLGAALGAAAAFDLF